MKHDSNSPADVVRSPWGSAGNRRLLFDAPDVRIASILIEADDDIWTVPGQTGWALLTFPYVGYGIETEDGRLFLSPNEVLFVNPDLLALRDRTTRTRTLNDFLWVDPSTLEQAIEERDPGVRDRKLPFLHEICTLSPETFLLQRRFQRYIERAIAPDPLLVEETVLDIICRCLDRAYVDRQGYKGKRTSTESEHRRVTNEAKIFIGENLHRPIRLAEIAIAASTSPTHLQQIFRQQTSQSVHQHVTDLRVKLALDRLGEYRGRMTRLALELGFSSGQHFTNVFRTRFGAPPARVLRQIDLSGGGDFRVAHP